MNKHITKREYGGTYFVEFISKSLGATLFATDNEAKATEEYNRFNGMTSKQILNHLRGN